MSESEPIFLDHNATTPLLPEVLEAMLPYLRTHFGNPSSEHIYGARARSAVARARQQVAAALGCDDDEVVFASGGTEANNLAIRGVAEAHKRRSTVVTTVIEHPATAGPCAWLERNGRRVTRIGVDADGRAHLAEARDAIDADTALVTVMHSNNETGVLQPISELAKLARGAGALIHTDAAQSVGKVALRVRELDVDLLSVAGHKVYAPKGVSPRQTRTTPARLARRRQSGSPGNGNVARSSLSASCERRRTSRGRRSACALRDGLASLAAAIRARAERSP
jgi:cysteine desulfurase